MASKGMVVGGITFAVFMTEAMVHYNTGIAAAQGKKFEFKVPPGEELFKLGAIVGVASLASTWLIDHFS